MYPYVNYTGAYYPVYNKTFTAYNVPAYNANTTKGDTPSINFKH